MSRLNAYSSVINLTFFKSRDDAVLTEDHRRRSRLSSSLLCWKRFTQPLLDWRYREPLIFYWYCNPMHRQYQGRSPVSFIKSWIELA